MDAPKWSGSEVAIIGMDAVFPQSSDLEHWWEQLCNGVELIRPLSDEELLASGVGPEALKHPKYVKAGAPLLQDVSLFDAAFFGYSPRDAEIMDPQHRIFMECAYRALERAGYAPEKFRGRVGVFAGQGFASYLIERVLPNPKLVELGLLHLATGNEKDFLPTQLSYKLNLRGPSVNVQTACSTSLVAVHMACQSLLTGECDIALAGAVSFPQAQGSGYLYQEASIASPDGHCRPFDAAAQGTVFSSGAAVVVLKRLADALTERDNTHAIILGSAINNDGCMKVGFTAPSLEGQAEVIAEAQAVAGVTADSISFVEAHGTATSLGDPIEVAALTQAFGATTERKGFCALGSVKSNMGHLDTVAGIAGLIKTSLQLKEKKLVPSLNYEKPNPNIDFANSPFFVNTKLQDWTANGPRRAGVSSFGIGGTNAHVIMQEAPPLEPATSSREAQLLVLSAKTPTALDSSASKLAAFLKAHPEAKLADAAYTLQVGRAEYKHRRAVVCSNAEQAVRALESNDPQRSWSAAAVEQPPVVFMFPGQGAQHVNMARELYQSESVFRDELDRCAGLLVPHLGCDIRDVLYPADDCVEKAQSQLMQTAITQPALFAVEYALARLWMSWGIEPEAMIGHSIGEYVAACLAGVFGLEEALSIVAARGRLMQSVAPGAMLSVSAAEAEVAAMLTGRLDLAGVNAPRLCVVAGPEEEIAGLERLLESKGVPCRRLQTSHAFHSGMMDSILNDFNSLVAKCALQPPKHKFISNLTGTWIRDEEAISAQYWTRHLRKAVRFSAGIQEALKIPGAILLEVGPGNTLMTVAKQHGESSRDRVILASLPHVSEKRSALECTLSALGRLWASGTAVDWERFQSDARCCRIALPTYPFERKRYWLDPPTLEAADVQKALPMQKKSDITDWFYVPSWQRSVLPSQAEGPNTDPVRWLLFSDACGTSTKLEQRLAAKGHEVITVHPGAAFRKLSDSSYAIDPARREDYIQLVQSLAAKHCLPQAVAHLWTLTAEAPGTSADLHQLGFYSLLYLAQALVEQGIKTPVRLAVVSDELHQVLGTEAIVPEKATLLGPATVIPQEHPNLTFRSIEIDDLNAGSNVDRAEQLISEILSSSKDAQVAYRGAHRWRRVYEPVRISERVGDALPLREKGVYLITGGLGGMGLVIAEHLARAAKARLVLTARSPFPERAQWDSLAAEGGDMAEKVRKMLAIEAAGAEVLICRADILDESSMRGVLAQVKERFGELNGVIHAAGVAGGGLMQLKTKDAADAVLAPKVKGTTILAGLLAGKSLDFLVLCSSITSVVGAMGQVDYCAANAFLDAFAQSGRWQGGPVVAINWDAWREVGMAVNAKVPDAIREVRQRELLHAIGNTEGVAAFLRIVGSGLKQVVVSTREFEAVRNHFRPIEAEKTELVAQPAFAEVPQASALHSRPELQTAFAGARHELDEVLLEMWQGLLGIDRIGIHDNFFELGGHSLLATQVISRVHDLFKTNLPLRTIFEASTVCEFADYLIANDSKPGRVQKIASVLKQVQRMSAEDVTRALQANTAGANQARETASAVAN